MDQLKKQKQIRRVSQMLGRQKNNPQLKGKEEFSERVLNEMEASQLPDIQFKSMVIRKLKELAENYQKIQGSYEEHTANYISMKYDIETLNKSQEEVKNTFSELNTTVE